MTNLGDLPLANPIAGADVTNTPAGGIAATDVQGAINELDTEKPASGAVVLKSLYDANTVLAADTDDTPAALTMGASTILARLAAGNIKAATPTEIKTLLAIALDDLTDVAVAAPAAGNGLLYDGTNFVNGLTPPGDGTLPAGANGHTISRAVQVGNQSPLSSQRLTLISIWLVKGVTLTSITFVSGSTALSVGVNQLFGIYDDNSGTSSGTARALLRGTTDDTSTAWAGNTAKTLNLTSSYTPTRTGQHFLGILINATTVPTLHCTSPGNTAVNGIDPKPVGTSNTGVTALPNPANALTVATVVPYAYWS